MLSGPRRSRSSQTTTATSRSANVPGGAAIAAGFSQTLHGLRKEVRDIRRLGQYTVEKKLGEGGMGVVYRASHAMLRRLLYRHMHDWGSRFHVDIAPAGGTAVRVYDVESWDPTFRDEAPINAYDEGEFLVAADDVITTSCTWMNDTAGTLALPQEMCVALGMAYPAQDALMCIVTE